MIELYVVITLLGIGYLFNQTKISPTNFPSKLSHNEKPSNSTPYKSSYVKNTFDIEKALAARSLKNNNVVKRDGEFVRSQLTGRNIPSKEFVHNNMMPFFKRTINQNMAIDGNKNILETFGSSYNSDIPRKQEREPLFIPEKDVNFQNGIPNLTSFYEDRYVKPIARNNTLPFEQVRVGPGLGKGYDDKPVGGYQQDDMLEMIMPKTVDEMRVKTNPKQTFESRTVDGMKGTKRGKIGEIKKNRVETYYENDENRYFKTTGAYLKNKQQPCIIDKPTSRQDNNIEYQGIPYANKGSKGRAEVKDPNKNQLEGFDIANPKIHGGPGDKHDFGKGNILVYKNERDFTTTRTYQGNVTSIVKAIIAPLEDVMKISKKEYMVDNPRHYGQMSVQIPSKPVVRDPNDVTRTTIKETTLHDAQVLNLVGGAKKSVIYDPNHVARTTLKETMLHDSSLLNLKANVFKTHVFDPNDVAKTTIKETLLHDTQPMNIATHETRGKVYTDEKAKTTLRETLDHVETTINVANVVKKGKVFDPNNIAKTTIKETTLHENYIGNIDKTSIENGGYQNEMYDMKITHREDTTDNDYYGGAITGTGNGYINENFEMKDTQKEDLSNKEYYGNVHDQSRKVQMSYDASFDEKDNDELKEATLVSREPTKSSVKIANGMDSIVMQSKKIACDETLNPFDDVHIDRIINELETNVNVTKERNNYDIDDRLDIELLQAYRKNPYTKPLDSFA